MELIIDPAGEAEWKGRRFRCALGHGGVRRDKREGDGATPAGSFGLVRVLYRPDRMPPPASVLPVDALSQDDGWCDEPSDSAYNRPVTLPYPARCETMWREDHVYDVVVVTGFNGAPVTPGGGSAIFLHLARPDFAPTEGCIAFTPADLVLILKQWGKGDTVRVEPP